MTGADSANADLYTTELASARFLASSGDPHAATPTPGNEATTAKTGNAIEGSDDSQPAPGQSSDAIAACWTTNKLTPVELIFGACGMLGGLACAAFGFTNPGGHAGEEMTSIFVFSGFGAVLFLFGFGIIVLKKLSPSEGFEVTEHGISYLTKRRARDYRWDEIDKVLTLDFVASRFSEPEKVVSLEPVKGRKFCFRTSYSGQPIDVLQCVLENCDYIVRNPRGFTRNVK